MKYYFDTSSLVKIYHLEKGTEIVLEIYKNSDNSIMISDLCKIEFLSTLHRLYREKEISRDALYAIIEKFEDDICLRFCEIFRISSLIIDEAKTLIRRFACDHSLRTLDSIQISFFNIYCEDETFFVCSDKKLSNVAASMGIQVLSP
jgi:uncharacterized protein